MRQKGDKMTLNLVADAFFPSKFGMFRIYAFTNGDGKEHLALVCGKIENNVVPLVRIHSKCLTGDTLASLRCDCRNQLESALKMISKAGKGILLYLDQEGRGIGLSNKIKAYSLQDSGMDTVEANVHLGFPDDLRDYSEAAEILKLLEVREVRLITNNPKKTSDLEKCGIKITGRVPLVIKPNKFNKKYIETKRDKMNHIL